LEIVTILAVAFRVFCVVTLEIYLQMKRWKIMDLGKSFADKQWQTNTTDGISTELPYWTGSALLRPAECQSFHTVRAGS
jgi:hypothetical protein